VRLDLPLRPAAAAPFDVVGFGESSLDFLAVTSGWPARDTTTPLVTFEIAPGGQTTTALVACARLGLRAHYIGAFGDDEWAGVIRRALAAEGVHVTAVERCGVPSRTAVILIDQAGDRTVLERRDPALSLRVAAGETVGEGLLAAGRVLIVDATDVPAATQAAQAARRLGVPSVLDVDRSAEGIDGLLAAVDVIVASDAFAKGYAGAASVGEALAALERRFAPRLVAATMGPAGSLARAGGREFRTAARPVAVRDTTGAGDAFRGGFVAAWIRSEGQAPVEALLEYAAAVAGLNCQALGAQAGLPGPAEVARILSM